MTAAKKVALVTGTSTGIGLATSVHLARNGYQVFAGMRDARKADALRAASTGLAIEVVEMDVTSDDSVAAAFAQARSAGPIEVLVNNAGIGGASPLELTPLDEHQAMFDTNYFGAIRCIHQVVPQMRERSSGCIVNVTSMEGLIAMPNQVAYSASKWALECAGEALAHELASFGVRVVNVEPGVVMTNIFENAAPATRYDKKSPYLNIMRRNGKMFSAGFRANVKPEVVAQTIHEAIETSQYQLRWPVGDDAQGLVSGRRAMSDEDYVGMGDDLSDAQYNALYKEHFGIEL
jgi:NAD(P)-dependent dehydrogenase (short-subunit alcohol dehydrogenase family)